MNLFDVHIHAKGIKIDPKELIKQLDEAGMYGCCIFSNRPKENDPEIGSTFEERLDEVLNATKDYPDRLIPILYINPYEENIIEKINIAVKRGICGFKIICINFYVYEEKCMEVLREIARLDKPVFFHSGILWDGKESAKYNHPRNFEALIEIVGLRFSMGHCSWPWVDECIALYGKFLNAYEKRSTAEMFFDLTPGTPEIYRRDLLEKLFTVGYNVENNILFGTDTYAHKYNSSWAKKWLDIDGKIMDDLGVRASVRNKLYHDNLMRFLGKSNEKVEVLSPASDNSNTWLPYNPEVEEIIKKWYNILEFPKEFDNEFKSAVETIKIADTITIDNYTSSNDGKRNLLSFLYMCETLKEKYKEKNIPEEILIDTLKDIVIWNNIWSDLKGELYLNECSWLSKHLSGKLFKLGRLQFCMATANIDIPDEDVKKSDNVIEIHIPEGKGFTVEECKKSIEIAKYFFEKYFPEFKYKCFICHSWLLDDNLKDILEQSSNILAFQNMFDIKEREESDSIFKYIFNWNTTRRKLSKEIAVSSFALKVKEKGIKGGKFYENTGILKK